MDYRNMNTVPPAAGPEQNEKNKNGKRQGILIGILIGLLIALFLVLCVKAGTWVLSRIPRKSSATVAGTDLPVIGNDALKKIRSIEKLIGANFYQYNDEVTTSGIEDGIYRGIINSLNDPYAEYFSAKELEGELNDIEGISYGIGVVVSVDEELRMPVVVSVVEGSPAEEAGVKSGDIIYEVEGESTYGISLSKVVSKVKGLEGTTVNLTFYREGEEDYLHMDIMRKHLIETRSVAYGMLKPEEIDGTEGIGYIAIETFDEATTDQFAEALAELKAKGMRGLILDLRYNLGGDFNASVEIARSLLPAGMIVYTEDKNGNRKEYTCDGKREFDMPLVVLVNEYTASASEILSGAIKDHNKGTIVGVTTYGKGIVQRIFSLEDGSAVKLTICAYFTPSGNNIQGTGITPDVEVEFDREAYDRDGTDAQMNKAIEIIKGKLG
ncbi:MAG: S41 family peptidase [Lachnospiraceae bacterium]|nr:S41 family peptidase [Lachnospiraceae bacterium]